MLLVPVAKLPFVCYLDVASLILPILSFSCPLLPIRACSFFAFVWVYLSVLPSCCITNAHLTVYSVRAYHRNFLAVPVVRLGCGSRPLSGIPAPENTRRFGCASVISFSICDSSPSLRIKLLPLAFMVGIGP